MLQRLSLSVAVNALAAALMLIVAGGERERAVKLVCSVYVLASLVIPLKNALPLVSFEGIANSLSDAVQTSAAPLLEYEYAIENELQIALSERGIEGARCECRVNMNDSSGIYISELVIRLPEHEQSEKALAASVVFELTGCESTIIAEGTP